MKNYNVTLLVGTKYTTFNVTAENEEQAKRRALLGVKVSDVELVKPYLCHNPSHNEDLVALMNGIVADHIVKYGDERFQMICGALANRDFDELAEYVDEDELVGGINNNELSDSAIDALINNVCDDVDLAEIILFVGRTELKEQDWKAISKVFA